MNNTPRPIDKAAFGVMNISTLAGAFSLSMFNKHFEPSQFSLGKKFGFFARNLATAGILFGLNQFLLQHIKILKASKEDEMVFDLIFQSAGPLVTALVPVFVANKFYLFNNNFVLLERNFFIYAALLFFYVDYFEIRKGIDSGSV